MLRIRRRTLRQDSGILCSGKFTFEQGITSYFKLLHMGSKRYVSLSSEHTSRTNNNSLLVSLHVSCDKVINKHCLVMPNTCRYYAS